MEVNEQSIGKQINEDIDFLFNTEQVETTTQQTDDEFFNTEEKPLEEETPTQEVIEDKLEETPTQHTPTEKQGNFYSELIKKLVERGEWEDVNVNLGEEEVGILDLEDVDEETFFELKELQEASKKKELEENYIKADGLKDTDKQIVDILKKGGDVTQILQSKPFIDSITEIEITRREDDLKGLIYQSMRSQGYKENYIVQEIDSLTKSGQLDEEAQKVIDVVKSNYKNHLDATLKQIEDENNRVESERVEYRKKANEFVKSFEMKDSEKRAVLDVATKYDKDGNLEAQKLFNKVKEDNPQLFLEVVMLLKDQKLYESFKTTKIKNKVTLDTVKKTMSLAPKSERKVGDTRKKDEFDMWLKE